MKPKAKAHTHKCFSTLLQVFSDTIQIFLIFICLPKSCRTKYIWPQNQREKRSHLCGKVRLLCTCFCFVYLFICIYMFTFVCWFHLVNNSHTLKCTSGMVFVRVCAKEDNKNEKSFNFFFLFFSSFWYPPEWLPSVLCVSHKFDYGSAKTKIECGTHRHRHRHMHTHI